MCYMCYTFYMNDGAVEDYTPPEKPVREISRHTLGVHNNDRCRDSDNLFQHC